MKPKTITRNRYLGDWTNHVNQLIHPALDADLPIEDFNELKAKCMEVVSAAAKKLDADGFFKDHD